MKHRVSMKKKKLYDAVKLLAITVVTAVVVAGIFQLEPKIIPLLILLFFPQVAWIFRQYDKKSSQDKRFELCMDYLQQMIFSFEKTKELTISLKETKELYGEDEMGRCLSEALDYLEATYSGNSKAAALKIIEEGFPCRLVKTVHRFLLEAESTGGRTEAALDILKTELQRYRTRIKLFQTKCQKTRINIIVAVVAGMLLSASLLYLTPDAGNLVSFPIYQTGTVVMCVISLGILCGAFSITCKDWLKEKETYSQKELEEKLLKYLNKDQKVGRKTLRKILQRQINRSYPDWILQLTLLLQNRDVAGAIEESIRDADVVLKYYLKNLAEGIHDYPDSPAPFLKFLEEFKTPETENAMKMIYAISTGSCVDADKQLVWLYDRTQVQQEQAAEMDQENQSAGMYALFLAPTLVTSLKLILDLSVLLVSFMGQLGM
ncbi:MAG: hypothetical protein ACI4CC_06800 [Lachnospiraceae bacterium]